MQDAPTLLLVDDDEVLRERLARAFRDRGLVVHTAGDHASALAIAREEAPEMAVLDLRMPGPSGLDLLRELMAIDAQTKVVMLTGYGSIATTVDAMKLGAVNFLQKPADVEQILAAFRQGEPETAGSGLDFMPPSLERAKWEHINRVLEDCAGSVSETARRLNVHRRTLQRMLQKYPPKV